MLKLARSSIFVLCIALILSINHADASSINLEDIFYPLGQDSSLLSGDDGKITRVNRLGISDDTGEVYRFKYKSDGLSITGFAMIPRKAVEGEALPVIIYGRGGAAGEEKAQLREAILQRRLLPMAVKNNYVVLASEARGAQGSEGQDEWGGREMNDIAAMYKLAQSLPYAQKENVFFIGLSRGGTRAYHLAASDIPFSGIVAIGGVSDFFTMFSSPKDRNRNSIPKQFGLSLEEAFTKMSAVKWPEKIKKPLLIIHGTKDNEVPLTQSRELSKILTKAGISHKSVEVDGAGHAVIFSNPDEFQKIVFPWLSGLKK